MTAPAFHGWYRPAGAPWRLAVSDRTEAGCLRKLRLLAAREAPPSCELLVNTGRHPEQRKRPR